MQINKVFIENSLAKNHRKEHNKVWEKECDTIAQCFLPIHDKLYHLQGHL